MEQLNYYGLKSKEYNVFVLLINNKEFLMLMFILHNNLTN